MYSRVAANSRRNYSIFIDLKGAFDRANHLVILDKLAKSVSGNILRIIRDYFTNRFSRVYYEGEYSDWRHMQLGTPQGGVLSPTLFNVLMNTIAKQRLHWGTEMTIYADDIVIQAQTHKAAVTSLRKIEALCNSLGLVISPEKTKVVRRQGKNVTKDPLKLQGHVLQVVKTYKYMGVIVGLWTQKEQEVIRLVNSCNPRLALLRKVAWGEVGSSVPIVRRLYITMVRSLMDYAASVIFTIGKCKMKSIERIQKKAMRIILGCPQHVNIDTMRLELNLPSLQDRIDSMAASQIIKSVRIEGDYFLKKMITAPVCGHIRTNKWILAAKELIARNGLLDEISLVPYKSPEPAPWEMVEPVISCSSIEEKKSEVSKELLVADFNERLQSVSRGRHVYYCDGSLKEDGSAGDGVAHFCDGRHLPEDDKTVRLSKDSSTTQCELLAIAVALSDAKKLEGGTTIISDSMSALQSLTAKTPSCVILVNRINTLLIRMKKTGREVVFIWAPSHCGIYGNELADQLANEATQKECIDYKMPLSNRQVARVVSEGAKKRYSTAVLERAWSSASLQQYLSVTQGAPPRYLEHSLTSRRFQVTYSRIRLGYKYLWQFGIPSSDAQKRCHVCFLPEGHTLNHYILRCPSTGLLRLPDVDDFARQAHNLLQGGKLACLKRRYPNFANAR